MSTGDHHNDNYCTCFVEADGSEHIGSCPVHSREVDLTKSSVVPNENHNYYLQGRVEGAVDALTVVRAKIKRASEKTKNPFSKLGQANSFAIVDELLQELKKEKRRQSSPKKGYKHD